MYPPPPPQRQPAYPPPYYAPRQAVTRRPMPVTLAAFHWLMMICTCGLWTPVYLASKRKRKAVTTWQ